MTLDTESLGRDRWSLDISHSDDPHCDNAARPRGMSCSRLSPCRTDERIRRSRCQYQGSRSCALPPLRVSPELRADAEAVLAPGESLSSFVHDAVTRTIEYRKAPC